MNGKEKKGKQYDDERIGNRNTNQKMYVDKKKMKQKIKGVVKVDKKTDNIMI